MSNLKPPPVRPQLQHKSHVSNTLSRCTHVFVRHDRVRKSLQPPYDGPFKVLTRSDKHFTLQFPNRIDVVSIDRLKPAHIDTSTSENPPTTDSQPPPVPDTSTRATTSPTTTRITRSGRHVSWPKHLTT